MRALSCCLLALLLTACGAATATLPPPVPSSTPAPAVATAPATRVTSAPSAAVPAGLLFVRARFGDAGIRVVDTRGDTSPRTLPAGVPAPNWSTLYTATYDGTRTRVEAYDPTTGVVRRTTVLDGKYDLVRDGGLEVGGVSPDGRWLALAGPPSYRPARQTESRYAVLDTAFAQPPRLVTLDGEYTFDALANDGAALYLIEYLPAADASPTPTPLPAPPYRVVLVDLARPVAAPQPIVDKTTAGTTMAGTRRMVVVMPDGRWVFSLYLNPARPFIHALNLTDRFAVCIFLPKVADGEIGAQVQWSLARSADGARLYAANGALGTVVEIDATSLATLRTITVLPDTTSDRAPLAAIAHWLAPQVSAKGEPGTANGVVVTPDGGTLALLGPKGLLLLDTRDLRVRARVLPDRHLTSVAVSPNGARLYVVDADTGTLTALDPITGAVQAEVAGVRDVWSIVRAT